MQVDCRCSRSAPKHRMISSSGRRRAAPDSNLLNTICCDGVRLIKSKRYRMDVHRRSCSSVPDERMLDGACRVRAATDLFIPMDTAS